MTKYILNSGGLRKFEDKGREFFGEMVKGLGNHPRILLCLFAQKREDWEGKYAEYRERLSNLINPNVRPVYELAFPDKFAEQMKNTDVVVIYGGDDHLLQYWLKQYRLRELFKGKVVATSSAGSDAMVKHYWTCDWRECQDGLGLLPIKFIPHYKSDYGQDDPRGPVDWDNAHKELQDRGDKKLPIYALEEGDFKVFEVN